MDDVSELRNEAAATPPQLVWARGGPVFSHLSEDTVRGLEGATIASFGDAVTVGMWAFATGSLMAGLFQANLLPSSETSALFPLLLAYPGPVLLIAGLMLFRRNNSFLASTFCSFGAVNLARGALLLCASRGILPSGAIVTVMQGILFEAFAYIALSLLLGALKMNAVLVLTMASTALAFGLSGIPFIADSVGVGALGKVGQIGGLLMLLAAATAFYGGSAILVNTAWRRTLLPLGGEI